MEDYHLSLNKRERRKCQNWLRVINQMELMASKVSKIKFTMGIIMKINK